MPATVGRTRMPHNNRVSTSGALKTSAIWSKTIGHDPYAPSQTQEEETPEDLQTKVKAREILEYAKTQNQMSWKNAGGGTVIKDDFQQKMFLGLKSGKKRLNRDGVEERVEVGYEVLSSSSEDEFVEEDAAKKEEEMKKKKKKRKKTNSSSRRKYCDDDSDSSSSSSSSSDEDDGRRRKKRRKNSTEEKRRKRRRHHKKHKKRHDSTSSDDDNDDSSLNKGRRRRHKRRNRYHREKSGSRRRDDERSRRYEKSHDGKEDVGNPVDENLD